MSRIALLLSMLLVVACSPPPPPAPPTVVHDRGLDYITEEHRPNVDAGEHWIPWYRSGWRRVCDVCQGEHCQRVLVAPSTAPCPSK